MAIFATASVMLCYITKRENFIQLITLYSFLFLLFYILYNSALDHQRIYLLVGCAFACRFLLLFSLPNLSDDYFRFIWDGQLLHAGLLPFDQLPVHISPGNYLHYGLNKEVYTGLNSASYYSVYPPVLQLVFYLSTWFTNNTNGSLIIMKLIILLAETGNVYLMLKLLKCFKLPLKNVLLYVLNPLVIIELCGNIHFESLMLFFLLLSVWFFISQKLLVSSILFSLAVCTKLLPLMFLPFMFLLAGFKKGFIYCLSVCLISSILFLPFISKGFIAHIFSSVSLYFQSFEFNAGIYYLVRWIGFKVIGYNIIASAGLLLSLISFLTILIISVKNKNKDNYFTGLLFIITSYLLFTTTVHPWYLTSLVGLSVFTKYRFIIVWSALIPLSYVTYKTIPYAENLLVVFLEYAAVFICMAIEIYPIKTNAGKNLLNNNH
ncbi:MAG: hypothetical protein H7296_00700 [Bacteroidia bacterium]|nr:hypothetical protein [Bacteroidia bacterium]